MIRIVSFDIGHSNMAMVCATISPKRHCIRVTQARMFNLKSITCNDPNCIFTKHDRRAGHLTYHLVDQIKNQIGRADYVLSEQQPLNGMNDIEQCLLMNIKTRFHFRSPECVRTISPRSMHSHFKMSKMNKEDRIKSVIELTESYLKKNTNYRNVVQKEHLADACAFVMYFRDIIWLKPKPKLE